MVARKVGFRHWLRGVTVLGAGSLLLALSACQLRPAAVPLSASVNVVRTAAAVSPEAKLGARLFFETKLSGDETLSCASCHDPAKGFGDGRPVAVGIQNRKGTRNTPTIYEVGAAPLLFWDGRVDNLTEQALNPIVNPKEMGASLDTVASRLKRDASYRETFRAVYGEDPSPLLVGKAIAAFEKALVVRNAPWDRFMAGDKLAMNDQQKRGWQTFQRAGCTECHAPPAFTDYKFHNLGVGAHAAQPDVGRMEWTGKDADWGAFKTPTLRNVRRSGPWMHDGSFDSLEQVLTLYIQQGMANPHLDPFLASVRINWREAQDVLAFFEALTSDDNLDALRPLPAH